MQKIVEDVVNTKVEALRTELSKKIMSIESQINSTKLESKISLIEEKCGEKNINNGVVFFNLKETAAENVTNKMIS